MRILVIEDEKNLLKLLVKRLEEEGYLVDQATNGKKGLNLAESVEYDCIILDLMLPKVDGFTIIQKLRGGENNSPIVVLTAKSAIKNKVDGLQYGADDYITKPFSMEELIARVRAILRRKSGEKETILKIGDLTLDLISREVYRGDRLIELTSKEFAILEYLLRNKGKNLRKSQIVEHVWNYEFDPQSNIVEVYVRYLRKKIDHDYKKKLIHTVRGVGYKLI